MAENDPVARARAIAARLAAAANTAEVLGKRKSRWEDDGPGSSSTFGGEKKKKKVYIPVDKYPDINFMGLLIGPRGSNQKRMEDESGAKILIRGKGSSKDPTGDMDENEELHVLITGDTDEAIAKAQSAVEDILFNPQQAMRLKQEQLRKVAELNGTLNENYNGSSGSHYGPTSGGNGDSEGAEIPVPRALVGYIIGRGGETIRELQMKSGAHIQIQREEENAPPNADRIVSISGSEDTIEVAKKLIQNLIDERMEGGGGSSDRYGSRYAPGSNPDGTESIELEIPNERVGLIIGRGGTTIKSIQSRTGANVNIPQAPEPNNPQIRLITITGNADQKEAAKAEILAILSDNGIGGGASAGNAIYMQVPNERVGVIIGKKGETIKGIQERYGVRVQIPQVPDAGTNPPIRTICIQGPPEYLQSVKAEIDAIILQGAGGGNSHGAYGSQTTGYYGYDQYAQYGGYTQEQYEAYYQQYYQQQTAAAGADGTTATAATVPGTEADANAATSYTSVDPNATTANGVAADGIATPTAAEPTDPNDPNAYWNGFYEYAAYYGIEAANAAWGVTGQAALDSIESYKQYQQQQAANGADPAATAAVSSTGAPPGT